MLPGIARKVSIPFILLSLAGLILFGVGFGIRNFRYRELSADQAPVTNFLSFFGANVPVLDNAAKPEFFLFWAFAAGAVVVYVMSFVFVCWDHKLSKLLLNIFLPVFLLGAGGVLLVDGLLIYHYYQHNSGAPLLLCSDIHGTGLTRIDIHGMENYVAIEFAGVFVALVFYWIFLLISSCFASVKVVYDY